LLPGEDPEGYSLEDIKADNRGEAFGEEIRKREASEKIQESRDENGGAIPPIIFMPLL